jgi:hypothetical protein
MTEYQILDAAVKSARDILFDAEKRLSDFLERAENNTFDTLKQAASAIKDKLLSLAREDCEGSDNCGNETYTQNFIVAGEEYKGTLKCEYNRHDKKYYYIETSEFEYAKV